MKAVRGTRRRRNAAALLYGAVGLLSTSAFAQEVSYTASQTIGNTLAADVTIDASAGPVDITQNGGTTLELTIGGLTKFGASTASIGGGRIISDVDEIDLDSTGGDFTVNSALFGTSLALLKTGAGRVILGSTDATNHTIGGGIYINGGALQISADANLGADAGNANAVNLSGGTLEVAGNVNFSAARSLHVDTAGGVLSVTNNNFIATIDDANQLSGPGTFVKEGPGMLRITSANTIGGSVIMNSGILELQHTAALSGPSSTKAPITLNSGAQLNLRHDGPFPANFGNDITISGDSTIDVASVSTGATGNIQLGALNLGNATLTVTGSNRVLEFTGTTTVAGTTTINNSVDVRLGGQLTGNGSVTKTGGGRLALSGFAPNTFSDLTQVLAGTLELGKDPGTNAVPGDLIINGGTVRLVTSGQIADNSNVTLNTGSLELNNQTDTVSVLHNNGGVLTTGTGSILVTSPNTTILAAGSTIINPGGRLDSVGLVVSGGFNEAQPNGTISVGTAGLVMQGDTSPNITLDADPATPGTIVLRAGVSFAGSAGTAVIGSAGPEPVAGTLDMANAMRTFTISDGAAAVDMVVGARIVNGGLSKSGPGTLRLSKSNSYAGGTVINNGTLELTDAAALGTGSVLIQGGVLALRTDATSALFSAPLSAAPANSINLDIGRVTAGSAGTFQVPSATLGSAFIVGGANGGTLAVNGAVNLQASVNVTANSTITLNGAVSQIGSGSFGITKTGSSALILGGAGNNNYLGSTTINSGMLQLAKTSGLALPSDVTINGPSLLRLAGSGQISDSARITLNSATGIASFDLANQSETIGGLSGAGSITLGSGQLIVSNPTPMTFNGTISGSGQVNKSGNGELILAGVNSFSGGSTVSGGTLTYATPSASQSGSTLVSGSWRVNAASTLNFATGSNITTNQASVTLSGIGSAFAKFDSLTTNAGTFSVTDGRAFTTVAGVNNTGTITVGGGSLASALNITGTVTQLSGNTLIGGNWIVLDGGNLIFSTGSDVLTSAANIALSGASSNFPRINNLANNQGRFTITGGRSFTTAGALSNSGTISIGSGSALKISGTLTNTGTLDISGGAIVDYTGATPLATIQSQIVTGYAAGSWNGVGINSAAAALLAAIHTNPHLTAVGIADASALGIVGTGIFMGQSIDDTSVLLRYTSYGDANLDGTVNTADFTRLAMHFGQSSKSWSDGDNNYDGVVNALDFNAVASNFGQVSGTAGLGSAGFSSLVPEPQCILAGALLGLAYRFRKNAPKAC